MEMQYKQQTLHNNFMDASYASGGLQGHTWEFQWGPKGLEQAIKRIGMNPVITQNFSTDPMGRPLSMTYNGASYNGELYFHYDVQGNTSLLTDSNGNGVASFRYDLHSGQLVESWNPHDLELVNMELAELGGNRIEVVARGELIIQPVMPPALIELWVPLHLRSGPGSLPPGHVLPPGMTILEYWTMLYRMGLIDQMPEGGRYDDPFGRLTHQAPGSSRRNKSPEDICDNNLTACLTTYCNFVLSFVTMIFNKLAHQPTIIVGLVVTGAVLAEKVFLQL